MDKQIIAIDWSNSEDQTVVSSMCGNCGYAFDTYNYVSYADNISITAYKKCPKCGIEFKKRMIIE